MHRLLITKPAINDIKEAKNWYNKKLENLGNKFVDHVFKCFEEIQTHPFAYPNKHKHTREMYVKKFPYMIIFSLEENILFILRVFPCKTDPRKKYKNK